MLGFTRQILGFDLRSLGIGRMKIRVQGGIFVEENEGKGCERLCTNSGESIGRSCVLK